LKLKDVIAARAKKKQVLGGKMKGRQISDDPIDTKKAMKYSENGLFKALPPIC